MENKREKLVQALEISDSNRRDGRAERIEWISLHVVDSPLVYIGKTESMQLLREAREVFVDGHYIATLLLAVSFIEHTLVEELQLLGHVTGSPTFSKAIDKAREKKTFPLDWLNRAKHLSLRRNPFVHLKDEEHPNNLGMRIRTEGRHPTAILETDAKDAVELMFNFFVATLREGTIS